MIMDDVRVGDEQRLGDQGSALWRIGFECFDWERTVMLGSAIGGIQRSLEDCITYAKQREAFGKPIAHFQPIAHKLAEMRIRLETARLTLRHAAWRKDSGRTSPWSAPGVTPSCRAWAGGRRRSRRW
jgi:acyl-CoA dehydrogenase